MKLGGLKAVVPPPIATPEPEPEGVFGLLSSVLDTANGIVSDASSLASGLNIDVGDVPGLALPVAGLGAAAAATFVALKATPSDSYVASTMGVAYEANEYTPAMKDALALKKSKMSLEYKLKPYIMPVFDKVDEVKSDLATKAEAAKAKAEAEKAAKAAQAERELALKEGRLVELGSVAGELPVVGSLLSGVVVPNPFAAAGEPSEKAPISLPNPFAAVEE